MSGVRYLPQDRLQDLRPLQRIRSRSFDGPVAPALALRQSTAPAGAGRHHQPQAREALLRIRPGHPQQNGRHERMHLTLKNETTRPAGMHSLQQQTKFDDFLEEFNNERPHQALDMKCPVEVYTPSTHPYRGIGELSYPFHDRTALVTYCGRICIFKKKINLSTSLAGQAVGIKEVDDGIWLVTFMDYDLGYIDLEEKTLQPLNNPFGPKV